MAKTIIVIQCNWCGKDVEKTLSTINDSHKHNRKMFCNNSCSRKYYVKQRRDKYIIPLEKICRVCNEIKFLCEFPSYKKSLDGRTNECKVCQAKYRNQLYKKRKYGLTPDHEAEIFENQDGVCAICGCPPPLGVDHNHVTGVVRGLLCLNCNFALGGFKDNPDNLRKAAAYLESEFND